jgi:ribonuclease HII
MPDFSLELDTGGRVCGIDEVGRGPWAGPVMAAAVVLDPARTPDALCAAIDDSKKLSAKRREGLFDQILDCAAAIGVGRAEVEEIDRLNILCATHLAMARAFAALDPPPASALVDGNQPPPLDCPVRCVVRGDALSLSIAAASIIAKVSRDRVMAALAAIYPGYGWERNAGYGTAEHRAGLVQHGVTTHHRTSFSPIQDMIPKT